MLVNLIEPLSKHQNYDMSVFYKEQKLTGFIYLVIKLPFLQEKTSLGLNTKISIG